MVRHVKFSKLIHGGYFSAPFHYFQSSTEVINPVARLNSHQHRKSNPRDDALISASGFELSRAVGFRQLPNEWKVISKRAIQMGYAITKSENNKPSLRGYMNVYVFASLGRLRGYVFWASTQFISGPGSKTLIRYPCSAYSHAYESCHKLKS